MEGSGITEEGPEITESSGSIRKKIFVAGATGSTGKRIVEQLLSKGYAVKAGVRDLEKAKSSFSNNNPDLEFVKADVTEGAAKLAEVIGNDSYAVVFATGFRPGWDLFAPWKQGVLACWDYTHPSSPVCSTKEVQIDVGNNNIQDMGRTK